MKKNKLKHHVSQKENRKFKKFTTNERKCQYSRAVLRNHPKYTYTKLNNIIRWKFGSGITKLDYLEILKSMTTKRTGCPNCGESVYKTYSGVGCKNCLYDDRSE